MSLGPPKGFVPWSQLVSDPTEQWSFSIPAGDFSGATVTMTNDQGQALTTTNYGQLQNGYGDNTLSWTFTAPISLWSRAPADTRLNVRITNVLVGGQIVDFAYSVIYFVPS